MHRRIRVQAARRKAEVLSKLAEALESEDLKIGQGTDLATLSRQVETLARLEEIRSPGEQALRTALPVGLALAILAALWYIHQPSPPIALNVQATRVVTELQGPDLRGIEGVAGLAYLHADGIRGVLSSAGRIDVQASDAPRSVYVEGPVNFDRVEFSPAPTSDGEETSPPAKHSVVVAHSSDLTTLELTGFDLTLYANTEGPAWVTVSAGRQTRRTELSQVSLELTGSPSPATTRLYFAGHRDAFHLPVLRPTRISVRNEAFDRDGRPITFSSLQRGSISIIGTGREYELLRGVSLILDELDGDLRVSVSAGVVDVTFHGRAGMVALGDEDGRVLEDLRPSLAEWLSSDRALALAWSTLLFLAGLAVTVRNSLAKALGASSYRH